MVVVVFASPVQSTRLANRCHRHHRRRRRRGSYSGNDSGGNQTDDDHDKCGGVVHGYGCVDPLDGDDGWVG